MEDFLVLSKEVKENDSLVIVMSRKRQSSYLKEMTSIPNHLNNYFKMNSFILVYPLQFTKKDTAKINFMNPTWLDSIEAIDDISKTVIGLFKRR